MKITPDEDIEVFTMGGQWGSPEFDAARVVFKKVGGEWDPDAKRWYVPLEAVDALIQQIDENVGDVSVKGWNCDRLEDFIDAAHALVKDKYPVELKRSTVRRAFSPSLMAFQPLKGIGEYEDFQRVDIQRALNQNRFLFNWEMGLGKSYATVALFDHLRHYGCIEKAVLLTSGIGTYNLKNELLKFSKSLNDEDILVCKNSKEARKAKLSTLVGRDSPHKILITTYAVFKMMASDFFKEATGKKATSKNRKIPSIPFDQWSGLPLALFLDESHNLGNPKSQQSKCVEAHKKYFEYIYEFTGTFADKYEKMYQQMKILDSSLVGGKNFNAWVLEYGDIGTKWSEYDPNPKAWKIGKLAELNEKLMTFYSAKRKMDDCLSLPTDYEVPAFTLPMGKKHRELYKYFIQSELERMKEEATVTGKSVLSMVLNQFAWLQSACENPAVLRNTSQFENFPDALKKLIDSFDYVKDNDKVALMDEILTERVDEECERGIVWCAHPATVAILAEHYKKYNPVVVTSETEDKFGEVDKFKKDPKRKLLITSIFVLNSSVTLTEAKFNLYAERCFNYTIYSQSRGRIHRPGKTSITRTYHMVFDKSTDALLDANLRQKGEMINRLLSKDFFSDAEWKDIFNFKSGADFLGELRRAV